jgi:hypothetical protein
LVSSRFKLSSTLAKDRIRREVTRCLIPPPEEKHGLLLMPS